MPAARCECADYLKPQRHPSATGDGIKVLTAMMEYTDFAGYIE
jgi:hypothetical protein